MNPDLGGALYSYTILEMKPNVPCPYGYFRLAHGYYGAPNDIVGGGYSWEVARYVMSLGLGVGVSSAC